MSMPVKRDQSQQKQVSANDMQHWLNNGSNVSSSVSSIVSLSGAEEANANAVSDGGPDNQFGAQFGGEFDTQFGYPSYESSLDESVVDDLVSTLSRKLCLKSKSCHSLCRQNRMSPYQIHNSISKSCFCLNCKYLTSGGKQRSTAISDPYDLMQELLKEGALIKEAVKRLTLNRKPSKKMDYYDYSDDDFGGNENELNLLNS